MTEALYLDDQYGKEFDAVVTNVVDDKFVTLDKTLFYPTGGGQPHDEGILKTADAEFKVVFVKKFPDGISHEVANPGLKVGDKVHGVIDWDRRYKLMRSHTAAHVVSGMFHKESNALITGNQISLEKVRIDFSLENFDKEKIQQYINKCNELIEQDLPVEMYYKPREAAMEDPVLFKLAKAFPDSIKQIRVIDIKGFDYQADGGTHVKSLKEVGKLSLLSCENKGKQNRRVYFSLTE